MYDELVKALRETDFSDGCPCEAEPMCASADCIIAQAADAIEELQEDNAALNGTVSNLIQQIEKLSKPRWIPVAERLPKYGDWVLGIGPKKGYHVCEYRGISHFVYGGDSPWFSAKGRAITVTHWMPLPEPPKGDE